MLTTGPLGLPKSFIEGTGYYCLMWPRGRSGESLTSVTSASPIPSTFWVRDSCRSTSLVGYRSVQSPSHTKGFVVNGDLWKDHTKHRETTGAEGSDGGPKTEVGDLWECTDSYEDGWWTRGEGKGGKGGVRIGVVDGVGPLIGVTGSGRVTVVVLYVPLKSPRRLPT